MTIDGEPWFVGKDVAVALGYSDTFGALKKHVDNEDKQNCQNDSFETPRGMTIINESGLYSLILSSKLPSAKRFKHWVTSEVLPTLRKTGHYEMPERTQQVQMVSVADAIGLIGLIEQTPADRLYLVSAVLTGAGFDVSRPSHQAKYIDTNRVGDFLKTTDPVDRPAAEVYEEYLEWCVEYEVRPANKILFTKLVNQYLDTAIHVMRVRGETKRVFVGKTDHQ